MSIHEQIIFAMLDEIGTVLGHGLLLHAIDACALKGAKLELSERINQTWPFDSPAYVSNDELAGYGYA